ncbi:MAG: permease-like cell division protein FtsX [Thermodesulfovibrionales bacterium]|nr:permease-like cell division protein FtsX [Thermodesulfovibrionales bacterium]
MSYTFRSIIQGIYREKWINILSVLAIGSSLLFLLITAILIYNFHIATSRLPELFSLVVYLKDNLSQEGIDSLVKNLKSREDVIGVKYFSKSDALAEFKNTVKGAATVLEGLDENPLSSYIEVKLKKDYVSAKSVENIATEIRKLEGIDEVYYGERIAETIYFLKKSSNAVSVFLFIIVSVVVIFISYSTVKILFYRKKEEIEILRLLGATNTFIRTPFIFEGAILGILGGVAAIFNTGIVYLLLKYKLGTIISIFEKIVLPWQIIPLTVVISFVLGVVGSLIAVGRIKG